MDVAEASFNTLNSAISSGLIDDRLNPSIGKPSTTYKGELSCVIELPPRMIISDSSPGWPESELTCNPATRPAKACAILGTGARLISSTFTSESEPVKSFLFTVPYPITTTSSILVAEGFMITCLGMDWAKKLTVSYPTNEKEIISLR